MLMVDTLVSPHGEDRDSDVAQAQEGETLRTVHCAEKDSSENKPGERDSLVVPGVRFDRRADHRGEVVRIRGHVHAVVLRHGAQVESGT